MLVEVGVDDLAMSPSEASMLLREAGLELDFSCVQALVQRTEGWPAALYLAALSVREQEDQSAAALAFRGDDHRIAEYLRDEVFAGWPDQMMDFRGQDVDPRRAVRAGVRRRARPAALDVATGGAG